MLIKSQYNGLESVPIASSSELCSSVVVVVVLGSASGRGSVIGRGSGFRIGMGVGIGIRTE